MTITGMLFSFPKKRRKSRLEVPFFLLRGIAMLVMKLAFRFEVRGNCDWQTLPEGVILAGNHSGYLDSLAVLSSCPKPFYFLMRHEVFDWQWVGQLVPYANIIPLFAGREKRTLVSTVQYLRNSGSVCIFPEGRLSANGELEEFNPGVAFLQQKSGRPIVPFAICGGYAAWAEGRPFPSFRPIQLMFGEPILPGEFTDRDALTEAVRQRVQALLTQHQNQGQSQNSQLAQKPSVPQFNSLGMNP